MCQLVAVSTPSQNSWPHANQIVSGTKRSLAKMFQSVRRTLYLEGELLIEGRIERLPVDFGLKLLLLVWQQVDLYVRVRGAAHVHGRKLCGLDDPHNELNKEDKGR